MSYISTFIAMAEDSKATAAKEPKINAEKPSKAALEYQLLTTEPYVYDHDALSYTCHRLKAEAAGEVPLSEDEFFSKGHPCLRASSLTKTGGWGAHYDDKGRIALVPMDSADYARLSSDPAITQIKAMRSKRA